MRALLALALLAAAAAPAAAAKCRECGCVAYLTAIEARTDPTDVALNARLRPSQQNAPLVLRPRGGAAVPRGERAIQIDGYPHVELEPRGGLARNTDYELVIVRGERTVPLQSFRTGDGDDTTPPSWVGIRSARYLPPDSCAVDCQQRRDARIVVTTEPPEDDRSGAELIAVWLDRSGGTIDYARPPLAYVTAEAPRAGISLGPPSRTVELMLGGTGPCETGTLALPRGARKLRLGMRPVDRAGNAGAASETTIEIPGGIK